MLMALLTSKRSTDPRPLIDNIERTQQVSIMDKIYQQASQLTIWLGEEDDKTGMGMTLIAKLASIRNEIEDHQRLKTLTEYRAKELGIPTFSENSEVLEKWQSLSSLLARPWFRRVWVRDVFFLFCCPCNQYQESPHRRASLELISFKIRNANNSRSFKRLRLHLS